MEMLQICDSIHLARRRALCGKHAKKRAGTKTAIDASLSSQNPMRGRIALADQAYRELSTLDELIRISDRSAETKSGRPMRGYVAIINAVAHGSVVT